MNLTQSEQNAIDTLEKLTLSGYWVELSLHAGIGDTCIRPTGNRLFINEGRHGKFDNITESVYDTLVNSYDSRYHKNKRQ